MRLPLVPILNLSLVRLSESGPRRLSMTQLLPTVSLRIMLFRLDSLSLLQDYCSKQVKSGLPELWFSGDLNLRKSMYSVMGREEKTIGQP